MSLLQASSSSMMIEWHTNYHICSWHGMYNDMDENKTKKESDKNRKLNLTIFLFDVWTKILDVICTFHCRKVALRVLSSDATSFAESGEPMMSSTENITFQPMTTTTHGLTSSIILREISAFGDETETKQDPSEAYDPGKMNIYVWQEYVTKNR